MKISIPWEVNQVDCFPLWEICYHSVKALTAGEDLDAKFSIQENKLF